MIAGIECCMGGVNKKWTAHKNKMGFRFHKPCEERFPLTEDDRSGTPTEVNETLQRQIVERDRFKFICELSQVFSTTHTIIKNF